MGQATKPIGLLIVTLTMSTFLFAQKNPKLESAELNEVSGLVSSQKLDSVFFVVNDSGDSSRFFAIDGSGHMLQTFHFEGKSGSGTLGVVDCEELAMGPGDDPQKNYLYVGDIGDNNGVRPFLTMYRFEEPMVSGGWENIQGTVIYLKYPDHPRDAEAFVVDPILKKICIISKREDTVGIYETSVYHHDGDTVTLEKTGKLFFPKKGRLFSWQPVAADISKDGMQMMVKTYGGIYYWKREGAEPIATMLTRSPESLPYKVEPQGETVAFDKEGTHYLCISEGKNPIFYKYPLKKANQKE